MSQGIHFVKENGIHVIPATPGFTLVEYWPAQDGERPREERCPVVAWRFDAGACDDTVAAIGVSGMTTADDACNMWVCVICPEGQVYRGQRRFESLEKFKEWADKEWKAVVAEKPWIENKIATAAEDGE
jgi:hypothetical protein